MRLSFGSFLAAIKRHPRAALGWLLALHAVVWTTLPALFYPNLPLDLIEALTYGREWQLGYDKLPPLPWWLVEIVHRVIGYDFGYYLLAQVSVCIGFLAVFAAAKPLIGGLRALIAILIVDGLHYFNYTAAKFNHDVIQLPLWGLAGFALHRSLRTGRPGYWVLLGATVGGALWAKYFVVVLAAPMALFMVVDRDARRHWRTPGPYLALGTSLLVMAPHLVWLVANDFFPFAYAEARAAPSRGIIDHLWHPAAFALSQLGFLLPSLLIATPLLAVRASEPPRADAFDRRIVTWLAFGPAVTLALMSAVSGRGTVPMWGYPLWLYLGVWIVMAVRPGVERVRQGHYGSGLDQSRPIGAISPERSEDDFIRKPLRIFRHHVLARVTALWVLVGGAMAVAFIVNYAVMPHFDDRYRAVLTPGRAMADELARRFHAATGQPLRYVIADIFNGGNLAHYAPTHPEVLVDGAPRRTPWIDLADLRRHGAVVVWTTLTPIPSIIPRVYRAAAPNADVQPSFVLPFHKGPLKLHVHWALLRPQG